MKRRNGSLDILRGLAILMVVNCHAVSAYGSSAALYPLQLGGKGVDLFFVLSGWLLGYQLLSELKSSGTVDVSRFWYRRWLRTLPAYYAVLAMTFLWQAAGRGQTDLCWSYLFFGQTYLTDMPYFGVSWSLCVEEHFYLAIAPLLVMFFRYPKTRWLLPVLLLVPPVCRGMGWYGNSTQTHVRWDQCACGVGLAYVAVYRHHLWQRLCRFAPLIALAGLSAAGANVLTRFHPEWGAADLGPLPWAMIAVSLVLLGNSSPFWKQRFHLPGARYLADRSYSLYLLHVEALALLKHAPTLPFPVYLALVWIIGLLLAEVLYRAVEQPFMQAREWFAASRTARAGTAAAEALPAESAMPVGAESLALSAATR